MYIAQSTRLSGMNPQVALATHQIDQKIWPKRLTLMASNFLSPASQLETTVQQLRNQGR